MKFDFEFKKCSDVGLIVKHGNSNNVVFFFDENEDAANYSLELYRLESDVCYSGFLREVEEIQGQEGSRLVGCDCNKKQFLYSREKIEFVTDRRGFPTQVKRYETLSYPFEKVKPICSLSIDRNTYYASVYFLPLGQYICILNIENRTGEIVKSSVPYCFKVEAKSDISQQLEDTRKSVNSQGTSNGRFTVSNRF